MRTGDIIKLRVDPDRIRKKALDYDWKVTSDMHRWLAQRCERFYTGKVPSAIYFKEAEFTVRGSSYRTARDSEGNEYRKLSSISIEEANHDWRWPPEAFRLVDCKVKVKPKKLIFG